ncbi:T9SS type A sorting domain-containing protein [Tamlana sp. 62-3]|uniref:T9SS type A sorting domain-containing protein n=1 Tax=Neotamlana sargassicola TaxID=2883125 RepID=A0A9X1L4K3_9FLAO|nr:T9SS type A sorting domain-containing protein [Tamlana sargassicola]MCB4808282.1 T9SS type A sorting domain-containing protein [Tamlana sargassicola]
MHYKAFLLIVLISHLSFSQLSIRNNAYVYVNNELVFVEDDINLNEAASTVYLRNEAQIIQGTGTTGNSGVGELSIYQNGNVGAYEYNYWCSPIGSKTSNNNNNPFGATFLNDIVDATNSTPAVVSHNPGYNGTANPLDIEMYWIWKYIASDEYSDWIHVTNTVGINPGEGFTMKGTVGTSANNPGDNQNYDFRGKPNTGDIGVSVLANQFTLVGNPYPSALDARAYIWDTNNQSTITGTLYYWEQNPTINSHNIKQYDGGYASYTIDATGTVETYTPATFRTYDGEGNINGTSGTIPSGKTPRRYIPVGQGFMVEGIATGDAIARNSHRVFEKETSADSEFFKTNKKNKNETPNAYHEVPEDYKRFRLNIDFDNKYTRQIVETLHPTATIGFDYGLESKINKNDILASDAYWIPQGKTFIAEALPYDESRPIPLGIKLQNNMPITVRITDIQNFNESQPIFLHDNVTNLYYDLRTQNFDINLDKGTYHNRFEITFTNKTLNTEDEATFTNLNIYQNNTTAELNLTNPNLLNVKSLTVFDISGKQVLNYSIFKAEPEYSFSTQNISDGIYVAKITLESQQTMSKKIAIKHKK